MLDIPSMLVLSINIVWCAKTYQKFDPISQITGVTLMEIERVV